MKNDSLKNKILASFIIVILLTGIITAIVGVRFIGENIVPKQKGKLDLNAAFQVYNDAEQDIITIIRLTSSRFFLVEGIKEYAGGGSTLRLAARLEKIRDTESFDFLNIADTAGKLIVRGRNPGVTMSVHATDAVVRRALQKRKVIGSTEIFSGSELLTEGEALVSAVAKYRSGDNTVQSTDGMVIVCAAPVLDENGGLWGVIYGGKLLNGNFAVVDKIVDLVYEREEYNRREICVSTIFMHDERISTNIRSNRDFSSIGTKLPADIYGEILGGDTIVNRKVVIAGHPYRAAYGPIRNISGDVIGVLGVGILEEKIWGTQRRALFIFIAITFGALLLSMSISQWLAGRIMQPIKSLLSTTAKIAKGNYDQKVDLHNAPEEIAALGNEFNRMIASIKERDRKLMDQAQQEVMRADRLAMIGQLAAGVAHEINNPLGSILLFNRLLLQKAPADEVMRGNLQRIEKETKRCQNIVQGLLEFSRQREPKMENVDVNDLLVKTLALFENQAMFHNIHIEKEFELQIPPVTIDPAQVQQVFVNIIINAADAMNGKGQLTVHTRFVEDDRMVEIAFSDTGCGIPAEQTDKIFEPFYTTKAVGYGTGLGLSISLGIIQRHGGTIRLSSAVGTGTTFFIRLPSTSDKS